MSTASDHSQHCPAVTRSGQPCRVKPGNSGFCFAHAPDANSWRARGGANHSNSNRALKLLPARLMPIFARMERVFLDLDRGEYDRRDAVAMAAVAAVLIKIVQAGEMEERVRILEKQAQDAGLFAKDRYGNPAKGGPIQWPTTVTPA